MPESSDADRLLLGRLAGVDGLDPEVGLHNVGGRLDGLVRVLGRFVSTYRGGAPDLLLGATPEQAGRRRVAAHALRGAAATIGAITLEGLLEAFEHGAVAAAEADRLAELARRANDELVALTQAIGTAMRG